MISLEKYNDKTQTILQPKEIELKIEYGFKQYLIILDKIIKDSFYLDIKNEFTNHHLKEVNLSFVNEFVSSELLNILNNKTHMIVNVKMEFQFANTNAVDIMCNNNQNKIMELKQTIMYIDDIELDNEGMRIYLTGHMVI